MHHLCKLLHNGQLYEELNQCFISHKPRENQMAKGSTRNLKKKLSQTENLCLWSGILHTSVEV